MKANATAVPILFLLYFSILWKSCENASFMQLQFSQVFCEPFINHKANGTDMRAKVNEKNVPSKLKIEFNPCWLYYTTKCMYV